MKNIGFKILYIITAIVIFVEIGFAVKSSLFTDISELPCGELSYSEQSPNRDKTLNVYVVKNNYLCEANKIKITETYGK